MTSAAGGRRPTLAVVGATGVVGAVLLQVLSTRHDAWGEIRLVAWPRSVGTGLRLRGEEVVVQELTPQVFDGVDVAVFAVPDAVSARWVPVAVERGAVVVDQSASFRLDPDVPLVVPEVNPAQVRNRPRGIIASPHCTTAVLMDVLGTLHRRWGLTELVVASYQAASGTGQDGIDQLAHELKVVTGQRNVGQRTGDVRAARQALVEAPSVVVLDDPEGVSGRPRRTSSARTRPSSGGSGRPRTSLTPSTCSSAATTSARGRR